MDIRQQRTIISEKEKIKQVNPTIISAYCLEKKFQAKESPGRAWLPS